MQPDLQITLSQLLDIIDYPNNKQHFIEEFDQQNRVEAALNLLETLPSDIQDRIKQGTINQVEVEKYLPKELYEEELTKVSKESLKKFIEDMKPHLLPAQIDQLTKLTVTQNIL